MSRLIIIAAVLALSSAANAEQATECRTGTTAVPAELAGWDTQGAATAAADAKTLKSATLTPGKRVDAALKPTHEIRYLVRPEKPGGSVSYGGMFSFDAVTDGTYRIALGSAAWIDVLKGKTTVTSSAHGHGPACSGIRKIVDFPLKSGRHTLQIAANGENSVGVMVARLP